jgi:hypothetical protein
MGWNMAFQKVTINRDEDLTITGYSIIAEILHLKKYWKEKTDRRLKI